MYQPSKLNYNYLIHNFWITTFVNFQTSRKYFNNLKQIVVEAK
jgi:hypothetical protein